jgi:hypothetical protein
MLDGTLFDDLIIKQRRKGGRQVYTEKNQRADRSAAGQAIDMLKDNQCRWPIGDPREPGFHFCEGKKVMGRSYCPGHEIKNCASPKEIELMKKVHGIVV